MTRRESLFMFSRNRNSAGGFHAPAPAPGYEHLSPEALSALQWLGRERIDYVVVGSLANAIRLRAGAGLPATIVPAPYGRNLDRVSAALASVKAGIRPVSAAAVGLAGADVVLARRRITADELLGSERLTLRCSDFDLDIEARPEGVPSYQDLLFDASRVEIAAGLSPEVASLEHIKLYLELRRHSAASPTVTQSLLAAA